MHSSLSLFDSFFAPPTIVVVSEERLQAAERQAKERQLKSVETRISELTEYKECLSKEIAALPSAK